MQPRPGHKKYAYRAYYGDQQRVTLVGWILSLLDAVRRIIALRPEEFLEDERLPNIRTLPDVYPRPLKDFADVGKVHVDEARRN